MGWSLYMDWGFFEELWEDFTFTLVGGLTSSLIAYPSLQILFNKNYAVNMLSARGEIYKICADRRKKFTELEKTIKHIKIYLCTKKCIYISFYVVLVFRIFDVCFSPVRKKKFLVSLHPTIIFDLLKPLYFGLNKIMEYYKTGITFLQNNVNKIRQTM